LNPHPQTINTASITITAKIVPLRLPKDSNINPIKAASGNKKLPLCS
jgi:hypothetical protein